MKTKIIISTLIAVMVGMLGAGVTCFLWGRYYEMKHHRCSPCPKHYAGYDVLPNGKVKTCCGDTIALDWKPRISLNK